MVGIICIVIVGCNGIGECMLFGFGSLWVEVEGVVIIICYFWAGIYVIGFGFFV